MGNGRKKTPDAAKARPWAAYTMEVSARPDAALEQPSAVIDATEALFVMSPSRAETGGTAGQSPDAPVDFCERPHTLRFEMLPGVSPVFDEPVRLVRANPPHVADAHGRYVGSLVDPQVSAILQCLADGFDMGGHISSVQPDGKAGEVRVSGAMAT